MGYTSVNKLLVIRERIFSTIGRRNCFFSNSTFQGQLNSGIKRSHSSIISNPELISHDYRKWYSTWENSDLCSEKNCPNSKSPWCELWTCDQGSSLKPREYTFPCFIRMHWRVCAGYTQRTGGFLSEVHFLWHRSFAKNRLFSHIILMVDINSVTFVRLRLCNLTRALCASIRAAHFESSWLWITSATGHFSAVVCNLVCYHIGATSEPR